MLYSFFYTAVQRIFYHNVKQSAVYGKSLKHLVLCNIHTGQETSSCQICSISLFFLNSVFTTVPLQTDSP